jgi:hypothetical protein
LIQWAYNYTHGDGYADLGLFSTVSSFLRDYSVPGAHADEAAECRLRAILYHLSLADPHDLSGNSDYCESDLSEKTCDTVTTAMDPRRAVRDGRPCVVEPPGTAPGANRDRSRPRVCCFCGSKPSNLLTTAAARAQKSPFGASSSCSSPRASSPPT